VAESETPLGEIQPTPFTRRRIIAFGLAAPTLAVPWLAGCSTSDPRVESPGDTHLSARPSSPGAIATPSANPTALESSPYAGGAASEQALAALAAAILGGSHRQQLSNDRRVLITFLRDAHTAHAQAIANPLPSSAPVKIGGQSLNSSLALLTRRETAAAAGYRQTALAANGNDALLWASISIAAGSFAAAIDADKPPATGAITDRKPIEILPEVAAVQELVRQLHAMVYGYQLAIGKLKVLSTLRPRAEEELLDQRILRDRLIAWLRKRSAEIPVAESAYMPSVIPRNPATASRLIMHMQTAVQPFCGLWLAASASQTDRQQALSALGSALKAARAWGAPLNAWPGWSS
jgi:Domain of unknown function (DUF4439)